MHEPLTWVLRYGADEQNSSLVFQFGFWLMVCGKYYCLFDNAIVVPGKYNFDDTTKSFTTHNFAEDICNNK